MLDATLDAARANLAANESLYRNGRVTRDLVYRAEADVLEIEQSATRRREPCPHRAQLREPAAQCAARPTPLPEAVVDDATVERFRARFVSTLAGRRLDAPMLQDLAADRREELRSLDAAIVAGEAQQDLARAAFKPTLALGAEAGIQGD